MAGVPVPTDRVGSRPRSSRRLRRRAATPRGSSDRTASRSSGRPPPRLFDGYRFRPPGCLLVREGRIGALAERLTPPAGVPVLDARGSTLLPGLIDAHVHVLPGALQAALRAGVTTEVDDELHLLVEAGLPTAAALAAATSVPAAALGLPDRGTRTPGLRADLLLVDGDPERDITTTRRIAQVWRAGQPAR